MAAPARLVYTAGVPSPARSRSVHVLIAAAVLAAVACAGPGASRAPPPPRGLAAEDAREVLGRFADALDAGRLEEAHALLSARWRAGGSPARLGTDLRGAGPTAADQLARVRAALSAGVPVELDGGAARVALGAGRAAALVAEDGGWRVDALE